MPTTGKLTCTKAEECNFFDPQGRCVTAPCFEQKKPRRKRKKIKRTAGTPRLFAEYSVREEATGWVSDISYSGTEIRTRGCESWDGAVLAATRFADRQGWTLKRAERVEKGNK